MNRDYDVMDLATGQVVLTVRHLWPEEPVECRMCGKPTFSHLCVPYYCGPVLEGASEGGYAVACDPCFARWEAWNNAELEYRSWLPARATP